MFWKNFEKCYAKIAQRRGRACESDLRQRVAINLFQLCSLHCHALW